MISQAVDRDIPIDPLIKASAQALKKKLEKLISSLENSSNIQIVSPAYQWAQSPAMLFLDIKFSHRLDSPGCLEVQNSSVQISETKLTFTGNCARSTQRIKLDLDLEFHAEINPEESNYSLTSVGRLNVNLKKKTENIWPKPMKGKKPNNTHIWWEMKEKYEKQVKKFTGEYDDAETEKTNKSPEGLINSNQDEL